VTWALDHIGDIMFRAGQHAWLAGLPLVLGLVIALPLGWLAARRPRLRAVLLTTTGLLYTIPSLALFILLPPLLGTKILDPVNVIVAMTVYTVALLTRTVADGLSSVDGSTRQAAIAMGYGSFARFRAVDLPLAVPVIAAGLRVAAVSNVSIVSVASLIGISQLGYFLTDGYARSFPTEVWVGIVACLLLALVFDLVIQVVSRFLTPWTRAVAA
jgi:osmoprotectant transport system permease protein